MAMVMLSAANDDIKIGEPDSLPDNICLNELLTHVELDVAYCSEKLLNFENLLLQVFSRENEYESLLATENNVILEESVDKGLEFDFLYGILDSELRELDNFMGSMQTEIADARQKNSFCGNYKEAFNEIEEKLRDSEETLKQLQTQLKEMKMQCARFQRTLSAFNGQENRNSNDVESSEKGQLSYMDSKLKMQTVEQQRHILKMLEKSLARELDMEKKLSESRNIEEELKKKLCFAEHELSQMEEEAEGVLGRLFEAEIAAELLMGISKEIMQHHQILKFNLNGSLQREGDLRKLQNNMEQIGTKEIALSNVETSSSEHENSFIMQNNTLKATADSEASSLREKMHSLEEKLKDSETMLQNTEASMEESQEQRNILASEHSELKKVTDILKRNIAKAESLAAKCAVLTETNVELNEELQSLRIHGNTLEKVSLLEKKLRETDIGLQHAKASADASEEQQSLLYSAIDDMGNLIKDLKSRVSKAESRAENAEAKCVLLSEANLELNDELKFLRTRMKCLEISLNQADDDKIATAKEISITATAISDLVMQLATERERLHKQISSLIEENKTLSMKPDQPIATMIHNSENDPSTKASEEAVAESSVSVCQVDKVCEGARVFQNEMEAVIMSTEDAVAAVSGGETVRSIDVWKLNTTNYLIPVLILSVSMLVVYLFQLEKCPF